MKKIVIASVVLGASLAGWTAWAGEGGKPLTAEEQTQRRALIEKYDANRDGVLDEKEGKAMDKADKKALAKLGGVGTAKKSEPEAKVEKKPEGKSKPTETKPAKEGKGKGKK